MQIEQCSNHIFLFIFILYCFVIIATIQFLIKEVLSPRTIIVTSPHRNSARNNDYEFYLRRQLLL